MKNWATLDLDLSHKDCDMKIGGHSLTGGRGKRRDHMCQSSFMSLGAEKQEF